MEKKIYHFSEEDILKMLNDSNGFAVYEFIQVLCKRFMKLIPPEVCTTATEDILRNLLEEEWEKLAIKTGRLSI